MTNNDFYWYWFTNIAGIGVKTQKKLLAVSYTHLTLPTIRLV